MKNNYFIRYAVMSIIAQTGWTHGLNELERKYEPIIYIPVKCHLIKIEIDYNEKGEQKANYKVVFPYRLINGEYRRVEPEFNSKKCINCEDVSEVYRTYEEAKEMASKMNKKIVDEQIPYMSYDSTLKQRIDNLRLEMKEREAQYSKLSSEIEKNTADMVVDMPRKEQKVIVKFNGKISLKDMSLYEFIDLLKTEKYRVFHLSEEEFESLKKAILEDENIDLSYYEKSPLIINDPNSWNAQVVDGLNHDNQGFYIKNKYMSYDAERVRPLDHKDTLEDDSITKAYTLETYEEVIESYLANFIYGTYEEEVKVGNKTFQKKLDF